MKTQLTQTVFASTAHRYWNTAWTFAQNSLSYGADASEEGVGSNLRLDLSALTSDEKSLLKPLQSLKAKVDHQCLFYEHASSLEQITSDLVEGLTDWSCLRVWESDKLSCAIEPSRAMTLRCHVDNLTLELTGPRDAQSGLICSRAAIQAAVAQARSEFLNAEAMELEPWTERLFARLQKELKMLKSLRIDLGSHEYVHLRA